MKAARPSPRGAAAVPEGTAILYVSPWCMHCDAMREHLREEGLPFVERDIFDRRHRAEYTAEMRKIGRRPPAVPLVVLDEWSVLGVDNLSISRLAQAHRDGSAKYPVQEYPGATQPPTPRKLAHPPGGTPLAEPAEAPAILYVSNDCPSCGPARKFLRARKIAFVERDLARPGVEEQLEELHLTFHFSGNTVPSFEILGRGLLGFDDDGIDAILEWRLRNERVDPEVGTPARERRSRETNCSSRLR